MVFSRRDDRAAIGASSPARSKNSATARSGFPRRSAANLSLTAGYLAAKTDKLIFATGIANIWARDPITMSAASKTVGELSGGRFVLGIGVSHKPLVLNLRGHSYDKPYSYMKEYLPKLKSAIYRAPRPRKRCRS